MTSLYSAGTSSGNTRAKPGLAGVCTNVLFQVGLISISLMQTRGGMPATNAMVRQVFGLQHSGLFVPRSAPLAAIFRIGVCDLAGDRQQARNPFDAFIHVEGMVKASTACLGVV